MLIALYTLNSIISIGEEHVCMTLNELEVKTIFLYQELTI